MNPMRTALNAVTNASTEAVTAEDVLAMLRTGTGVPHQVRALFSDCDFDTLDRICAAHDISRTLLRAAYARARRETAAANCGFEEV